MAFTKIVGAGIHTLSNVHTHNVNSSGIITATSFVGPFNGSDGDFSGNVSIGGSLTVNGDFTTLNTTLREVEILNVDANSSESAGIITQRGSGDILNLFDTNTEVFTVIDGGNVGINSTVPTQKLDVAGKVYVKDTGGDILTLVSTTASGRTTLKLNTNGNDWELGARGSSGNPNNSFYVYDMQSSAYGMVIDSSGRVMIGGTTAASTLTSCDDLTISTSGSTGITLFSAAGNAGNIAFGDGSSGDDRQRGLLQYHHSDNTMRFFTNAGRRMTIDSDGKVGIGTDTPTANGDETATHIHAASYPVLHLTNSTTGTAASDGSELTLNNDGSLIVRNRENSFIRFDTNGGERLRIGSNGSVGIGTDHLSGNNSVYHKLMVEGDTTSQIAVAKILRRNSSASNSTYTFEIDSSVHTSNMSNGGAMSVDVNSGRAFTIDGNGKIGVGTASPSQELTVYGTDPIISVQEATASSQVDIGTGTVTGFINIQKADGTRTIQFNGSGNNYLNTGGNFGIGTGSPSELLTVRGGSTPTILNKPSDASPALFVGDSNRTGAGQHLAEYRGNWNGTNVARMVFHAGDDTTNKDNGEITFRTAAAGSTAERLRILSGGSVSIGNNPDVHVDTIFHVEKSSGETNVKFEGNDTMGARLTLQNNKDTGSNLNNQIGFNDAGGQSTSAIIGYNTDQTNNHGELVFATRSAQGTPPTERLRINSSGGLKLSNTAGGHLLQYGGSSVNTIAAIDINRYGNGYADIRLSSNYGASLRLAGASDNTDEFNITQDNQKIAYITNEADKAITFSAGGTQVGHFNGSQGLFQVSGDITAGHHHGNGLYGMLAKRKFTGSEALGGYAIRYASGYESPWIVGYNAGSSYNNQITFGSMTTADRSLATGVTKRMVIDMESGMVGIREDDPQKFLHVTGTTSSGAAHFGVFGTNAGNAYIGNTPVVTISTDGNANAGTNDDKAIFQVGRGGGGAGAASVTKDLFRVNLGGSVQIGGSLNNNTTDIDAANTKLTIKQSANNQEDGIYIERSGERRGWYQYVGGAGGTSDALCWTTNQLGTDNHVLALNRDGKMLFVNNGGVGAWFGALTAPSGDTATLNLVSTADKEASIGLSRSNSLGGITTGWRTTIDTSGHIQVNEHNSGNNPLTIMSKMVRPKFGINTQGNGGTIYTPGTTGFHGTQWITCGCMFPFFYLGERVSGSSTNYSADVLDIYASGHWNGYPKAVIIAHERYYKNGFAVWTFGPYINGSYTLEQVEGWGGYSGAHGNDRNGTVSITHHGSVNTHSGQPIHRYTVTIANSGTYSYTRWYIGFIHTGRGVYMSDTSVADVTSSTSSGACCHMRDISQTQAGSFSFKS